MENGAEGMFADLPAMAVASKKNTEDRNLQQDLSRMLTPFLSRRAIIRVQATAGQ
jgi:hypothetical protein